MPGASFRFIPAVLALSLAVLPGTGAAKDDPAAAPASGGGEARRGFAAQTPAGPPDSPEALIEAEHWRRARAAVEPLLRGNPDDPRANVLMARCLEAAGDYDQARALAEKAVALNPKSADARCMLAFAYARQAMRAGIIRKYFLARKLKKEAEAALAIDPRHLEAHLILIEFHRQAPGIVGGSKTEARRLAESLTAFNPGRGYIAQASLFRRDPGSAAAVEALYGKAAAADPSSYFTAMTLAWFYSSGPGRNPELAENAALRAIRLDPGRSGGYGHLARIYARTGRWSELDAVLAEAEKNVPDDPGPLFQAGRSLLQQGAGLERAEGYLRRYLAREPELAGPSPAQTYWRLGQVLEKLGRRSEAVAALERALRLDPGLDEAKKDLKRARRG